MTLNIYIFNTSPRTPLPCLERNEASGQYPVKSLFQGTLLAATTTLITNCLANTIATSHNVMYGQAILPIVRVETFSSGDWEAFIEEWLDLKKTTYKKIERLGGAGDKGRDIVASIEDNLASDKSWDCYQCKHYDKPLIPTQVYVEIGKIIYYTFIKDYSRPRKYYFVAPKGCGTSLCTLLDDPKELKKELKANWQQYCEKKITSTGDVALSGSFATYLESFDFTIFQRIAIKDVIEEHKKHENHLLRFGGGLPARTTLDESSIPEEIQAHESIYVSQLLLAYESDCEESFKTAKDIKEPYDKHFNRARLNFHYAEQLRNLYRDSLPSGTFELFQAEIYDSTANVYESTHKNGFDKVKAVENHASTVNISSNPLKDVSIQKDKIGICHQLCNESKFKWTP